jgi:tetratricopeptide (TPR) repeat protein
MNIGLLLLLLGSMAFCFATHLQPWVSSNESRSQRSGDPLSLLLGDARRMFANHFFIKADVYFHSGFYPSIYDNRESFRTPHIAEDAGAREGKNTGNEDDFLGAERDWIDAFGRKFFPSSHTHLTEGGGDGHGEASAVREILPWLRLTASLDPERVETYAVTAYWLRSELKKSGEAEAFLRDGLRANPGHPMLLFELGRIYSEDRNDPARARNVWELALRNGGNWDIEDEAQRFLLGQLLGNLARLEETQQQYAAAIGHLRKLEHVSPNPPAIAKWRQEVETKQAAGRPER